MDTQSQLVRLYNSLGEFKPTDNASWQLASIFNTLLGEVRATHGDNVIVQAIQPVEQASMSGHSTADCGTIRASVEQLIGVIG